MSDSIHNYSVYMHTNLLNNKKYVGITYQSCLNRRWMNGHGYKQQKYFYSAIQKYGWDNFQHEVLFENLSEQEAKKLEIELIAKYDLTNNNYGYNVSIGGDGYHKYKNEKEAHEVYLARQKRIHNDRKLDPIKSFKDKESNKRSRESLYADPGRRQQYLEKCCENQKTRYSTEAGRAKIKESSAKSRQKLKQLRRALRETYKEFPELFAEEQRIIAFGRNNRGRYCCSSIKKLSEVFTCIQQKYSQAAK